MKQHQELQPELLYFSSFDLMTKVIYIKEVNNIRYFSHRKMTYGERFIVEGYLLSTYAYKKKYYSAKTAIFCYAGVDKTLVKDLALFQLKNTLKMVVDKEKQVGVVVEALISQSMKQFYFYKIGELILEIKDINLQNCNEDEVFNLFALLLEAIEEYNKLSEEVVSIEILLPESIIRCAKKRGLLVN